MNILIIVLVVLAGVVVFSIQNAKPVMVTFLLWNFEASLAMVILTSVVAGAFMAVIVGIWRGIKVKGKNPKVSPGEIKV
jgi:lipopolysaccharide assembly protein A